MEYFNDSKEHIHAPIAILDIKPHFLKSTNSMYSPRSDDTFYAFQDNSYQTSNSISQIQKDLDSIIDMGLEMKYYRDSLKLSTQEVLKCAKENIEIAQTKSCFLNDYGIS